MSALAVVLRVIFGAFPNIKPLTDMFLVAVSYLGLMDAVVLMAVTMVVSGLLFGFGPVVLWQVLSYGVALFVWRSFVSSSIASERLSLPYQSLLAGLSVFLYGFVISLLVATQFGTHPLIFWVNGLSFDCLHAVSTVIFYPFVEQLFRRFLK